MPRFKLGDRVQLVGDIARFYACIVGVVVKGGTYPSAILNQYTVRLADGTVAAFFDFQLEIPPAGMAQIAAWMKEGSFKSREDIVQGLENFPDALLMLFEGRNFGKLILQVAPE